tara:strand:- start:1443 stop:1844 length:402 start_codon:yes stop_codon:yes gene_type:complete
MVKTTDKTSELVAVYGTLLTNCYNNGYLRNANLEGEFWTEPVFQMFSCTGGAYPYLLENGHTSVKMEVYSFDNDSKLEESLDRLEGVSSGLYVKGKIKTPHGEALLYIRKTKMTASNCQITTGSWKEFKTIGS